MASGNPRSGNHGRYQWSQVREQVGMVLFHIGNNDRVRGGNIILSFKIMKKELVFVGDDINPE